MEQNNWTSYLKYLIIILCLGVFEKVPYPSNYEDDQICLILQRLSTSVSMVAKGVLKEHLILLANSMTCAGSMVGFNSGGIKALSRSLNVQVPFTEATLFVRDFICGIFT